MNAIPRVRTVHCRAISHNRLTGEVPDIRGIVDAADNFFTSLAPGMMERFCFNSNTQINGGSTFQETCLPLMTASDGSACNSSGVRRSDGLCNTTCVVPCQAGGACYVIGDSMVQACPCNRSSYVSIEPPHPCKPLGAWN